MTVKERISRMLIYDRAGDFLWKEGLVCCRKRKYGDGYRLKALANRVYGKSNDLFYSATLTEQNQIRMTY